MGKIASLVKKAYITVIASTVSFFVGVLFLHFLQEAINKALSRYSSIYLLAILICMFFIATMVGILLKKTEDLRKSVGIKIRYVERDPDPAVGRRRIFGEVTKIVNAANKRIYVVNSCILKSQRDKHEIDKYEQNYYSAILSCVRRKNIEYVRILQLREGETVRDLGDYSIDDGLPVHLREMLQEKLENKTCPIALTRVKAQRFTTFVLIDDIHLIWQINEFREADEKLEMQGVFIIEDPGMEITRHFRTFFNTLRNYTPHHAVELADLAVDPVSDQPEGLASI